MTQASNLFGVLGGSIGDLFTAETAGDTITLTPVDPDSVPAIYTQGQTIRWVPDVTNTSDAMKVRIGTQAAVPLVTGFGDIGAGTIRSNIGWTDQINTAIVYTEAVYDSGSGEFRLPSVSTGTVGAVYGNVRDTLVVGLDRSFLSLNGVRTALQVAGSIAGDSSSGVARFSDDAAPARFAGTKSRGDDPDTPKILEPEDKVLEIFGIADDGNSLTTPIAGIIVEVDDVAGSTVHGRIRINIQGGGNWVFDKDANFEPGSDGNQNIGSPTNRCDTIYAATGSIQTSQRDIKAGFKPIDDALLDVLADLDLQLFQFKSAIELKGEADARFHAGAIVDDFVDLCTAASLDPSPYALFIKSKKYRYTERALTETILARDGKKIQVPDGTQMVKIRDENGDPVWEWSYGFRYTELLICLAALERRERLKLENRIKALEDAAQSE